MVMDTNHPFLFQGFACALSTKTKGVAEWLKAHQVAFKATASNQRLRVRLKHQNGGVAEWLKAHAWKVCIRETVSRVRIPLPPPVHPPKLANVPLKRGNTFWFPRHSRLAAEPLRLPRARKLVSDGPGSRSDRTWRGSLRMEN